MPVREAEMIANAQKPFKYNAEEDDEVLIVSDTRMDPTVWNVLNKAARSLGIEPTSVLMSEREYSYAEPTAPVAKAMAQADLVLLATSKGLAHSQTCKQLIESGDKIMPMSEITPETFLGGAASANYQEILEVGQKIKAKWDAGNEVTVRTPAGTDLTADITDCNASNQAGMCSEGGEGMLDPDAEASKAKVAAFPDGEVPITPVPGTTNGTLVWDVSMHEVGTINEPIRATVEDGHVTEITGSREAKKLSEFLAEFDDENVYNIGEISISTNPGAEITGRLREDKKAAGYLHIAVGAGGPVEAPIHIDGILKDGTVQIDDKMVVDNGEITV